MKDQNKSWVELHKEYLQEQKDQRVALLVLVVLIASMLVWSFGPIAFYELKYHKLPINELTQTTDVDKND